MTAIQFPLKLAFACTAHKMQGTTITKPEPLIIDLKSVKEPAQAYVMMSRVQSLQQLFILNEFRSDKIYPSREATIELARLNQIAGNDADRDKRSRTIVVSMNIRSLKKHHQDLLADFLSGALVIALQETWCEPETDNQQYALPGYNMHFESRGKGKGIVTYFKHGFHISKTINTELYQITKVTGKEFDVINVYCSSRANKRQLFEDLCALLDEKFCLIVGDFNDNYLQQPKPKFVQHMIAQNNPQLVRVATHLEGGILDHVYVHNAQWPLEIDVNFRYYSDHAAILVIKPS